MKKIALLLSFVMLLSLFAGCISDGEVSDVSVSEKPSESVPDEQSKEEEIKNPVEDPEYASVISTGKAYKNTAAPGESYPDSYNTELTDGQIGPENTGDYTDAKYSGYTDSTVYVTIDLGKVYDSIYEFRCGFLSTDNAGIYPPKGVKIHASVDGDKFTRIGECAMPEYQADCRAEAVLTAEYYVTARYIRFGIEKNAAWVFIDELVVIANEEEGSQLDEDFLNLIKDAYDTLGTVSYEGGKTVDSSLALEMVSKGAKYTASKKPLTEFPDENSRLTDGEFTGFFESGIWVGYEGGEAVTITVDLGKKRDDLSVFRAECYSNSKVGTYLPVAVTYSVSDDNKTFTDVGRVFGVASGQNVYSFPLILSKAASGRYVRFTLEATDTKMYLIEETAVYANTGAEENNSLYPPLTFDTTVKNWPNPSTQVVNLIKGLTQQINCPSDVNEEQAANNTPITSKLMTDGKLATANSIHNGQFFKFNGGSSRDVIYDLGATSAVSRFTAQFTHLVDWAVLAPTAVDVYLSMDGEKWYDAGTMPVNAETDSELVSAELKLNTPVQTRYICFSFNINTWCGVGELEAYGTTSTAGAAALSSGIVPERNLFGKGNQAPNEDVLGGVADLVLLYHSPNFDGYTVENLIPYLAYVDKDGNIKDTMFDSFLFLLSGGFPSGLSGWSDSKGSDWQWTITDLFTENENILALEEAAGIVKEALGLDDDYKYGFTVTLYYPNSERTDFGDINGDGVVDGLTTDENRLRALEWYMELFEAKLGEYDFENIEFVGYYWYDESIYPQDNAPYIVTETAKIVHNRGYDFFWIPYYTASGFSAWDSYGFDVACMQPNYVFKEQEPYSKIPQAAYLTQLYGMGIEIEISGKAFTSDIIYRKYMQYLSGGALYGYLKDCVHMYYQDVLVYYEAAVSKDESIRLIYDYTYQFIKGTLDVYPDAIDEVKCSTEKGTPISGSIIENAPGYMLFTLTSMPESGTVSLGNDGSFIYYPESDFTGTVSFTYTYSEGLCDSVPCTVTIEVK